MKYIPRRPKTNVNVTPASPLRELLILTGGLAAITVGVYLLLGLVVDWVAPRLSGDLERKLGVVFTRTLDIAPDSSQNRKWAQGLADRIQARCVNLPYQFKIHINPSKKVNALAFPGGNIVVCQGLLDQVASENELAFVLCHEMGHYAHRDHLRGLGRTMILMAMATLIFGQDSGVADFLIQSIGLAELNFSRQQETEADEFGLQTLHCFYGHVGGSTDFFAKISADHNPGRWGHYFSTHPANERRIARLKSLARELGYDLAPVKTLPAFLNVQ